MEYQMGQASGGISRTGAFLGGAAVGAGGSAAAMWARKVQGRANVGLGLGLLNTGVQVVGGNNNNSQSVAAANLTNTINSRVFTAGGATGPEVGLLKGDLAALSNIVSQVASNTDPMTVTGLRTAPTLPTPSTASTSSTVPAATNVTPATGLGNIGILVLVGLGVYLATRDE